jgi:hypothetical protein
VDLMLELGLALSGAALRGPSWSPGALFAGGANGFWLDPGGLAGVYQDAAGTIAVTGAGQPVGLLRDQSGLGRDFAQGTSAARPTLQQDAAGRHHLQFDGIDDWLMTPAFAWGSDAVTVIAAFVRNQNVNMEDLVGQSVNPPGYSGTWVLTGTYDPSSNTVGFATRGSGSTAPGRAATTLPGVRHVISGQGRIGSDLSIIRRNGVQVGSSAIDQGGGDFGTYPMYLGARGGTMRYFAGALYGLIAINRVLSAEDLALAEGWVAARGGVAV